jgi:hypothetical protein
MAYTTINKPSEYFNTKLYTGNNTSTSITGVGFQPDLTWFKRRDSSAQHSLFDSVRGVTKRLASNLTNAENTITDALTSFDSDGFTLGVDSSNYINFNTATYASWNWKANGSGVSNTDGSITSTVSASTTSGFSVVTYTGTGSNATVGHGLGAEAKWVVVKRLDTTGGWINGHSALGFTKNLYFTTAGANTSSAIWNNTAPTSSVFSLGTDTDVNASGGTYVAYVFAEKKGFSKFGSYTGNGSTDGTFVYTGFKPAYVIHKRTDTAGYSWLIHDNKRPGYNSTNIISEADLDGAEQSNYHMDLLSNGFKHRITAGSTNASGGTYIYMAFAENPLVGTNGVPTTAR